MTTDVRARPCLPGATLVICSRNRPRLLCDTVASVLRGTDLPAELLIVDQSDCPHPTLASAAAGGPCTIRYEWASGRGLSRARNQGLALARCPIVAYLDDDMFVATGWFGTLVRALAAVGPDTVVTGRVLPAPGGQPGGFVPAQVRSTAPAIYRGRLSKDVLAGGHMAAYAATLRAAGGFDERLGAGARFPAADDNDLGFRLLESGFRIRYVPEAVVYHRAWRSPSAYWRVRWSYGRGKGGFYAKHLSHAAVHMALRGLVDVLQRVRAFPGRLVVDPRRAAGDVLYVVALLVGATQWLLTERGRR